MFKLFKDLLDTKSNIKTQRSFIFVTSNSCFRFVYIKNKVKYMIVGYM